MRKGWIIALSSLLLVGCAPTTIAKRDASPAGTPEANLRAACILALSWILVGCAPTSIDEIEANPGTFTEFDVPAPPRDVFVNEIDMFNKCLWFGTNEYNSTSVQPNFDTQRNVASVALLEQAGSVYWDLVVITPSGSGSHVRTYTAHFPDNPKFGKLARKAAMGEQACSGGLF